MEEAISISFGDEDLQHDNLQSPHYGAIEGTQHTKVVKRPSIKINQVIGHQPCHQLEVIPRQSSSMSNATTESELNRRDLFYNEMSAMIKLCIPVTLTYIFEMLPGIITIILVGRAQVDTKSEEDVSLQKLHIDAAALAVMLMNVVALSPGFGILTAMDTLCSQAHGANETSRMGTYGLTGFFIISVLCVISSILLWNTSSLLVKAGQPTAVAHYAGIFSLYLIPGIPFSFVYELIRKVSQSRNEAIPMLFSSLVCNIVTISLGYYLVNYTHFGWLGAAIARTLGQVVEVPAILFAMIMEWGGKEISPADITNVDERKELVRQHLDGSINDNLDSISDEDDIKFLRLLLDGMIISDALHPTAVVEFLSLGFPGMLQLMFEWCAFEAIALLCGLLPGDEAVIGIGANAVVMNITSMTYMLYLGASVSGNVRIGNALGAGDLTRARSASFVTLGLGVFMSLINITFLITLRKRLPWLITSDTDIAEEAQRLLIVAAVFQFPDAMGACVGGIFRGSGRQTLAAKLNFAGFYIFGIPLGYLLGIKFFALGTVGLWSGMTVGLFVVATVGTSLVLKSDWPALVDQASARLERSASLGNLKE